MLLETIKNKRFSALKDKNTATYQTLTLVLGELSRLDNKQPTDSEVVKVISKMIKSATETNSLKPSDDLLNEISLLKSFLPSLLTESELSEIIDNLIRNDVKTLPLIMKSLKEKHNGLFDGKLANKLIIQKL